MSPPRRSFNPKRRIAESPDPDELESLARRVSYGGNPAHKRNPGNFDLTPPSAPRRDKTLCDGVEVFQREKAVELLRRGILRGLIGERRRGRYPQNVWSVTDSGHPLEAQLENREQGVYHGYPMTSADPFAEEVLEHWRET